MPITFCQFSFWLTFGYAKPEISWAENLSSHLGSVERVKESVKLGIGFGNGLSALINTVAIYQGVHSNSASHGQTIEYDDKCRIIIMSYSIYSLKIKINDFL